MQAELYEIANCPQGRLATMPRPRGGIWLKAELASLAGRGVTDIVSLLTPPEEDHLDLQAEPELCQELGLNFHRLPILDGAVPQQPHFDELIADLLPVLQGGGFIASHCRAGIGRASLVAAALLCQLGVSAQNAIAMISLARGYEIPDTDAQFAFILNLDRPRNS
jgi:protein-tyrosine phosphatase